MLKMNDRIAFVTLKFSRIDIFFFFVVGVKGVIIPGRLGKVIVVEGFARKTTNQHFYKIIAQKFVM